MKDNNWVNKEERAEKAKRHTIKMEKYFPTQIASSIKETKTYNPFTFSLILDKSKKQEIHGAIMDMDSVTAAFSFKEGKTAILNFASYKYPGGGFLAGSRAQEECLCHESYLYNVLKEFDMTYYTLNRKNLNKALYQNRALYTPNVIFMKDEYIEKFDVITCAAPNKKTAQKYQNVSDKENLQILKDRIKFVLDIAKDNNVETLILGAYGCGVFGQEPEEVAAIFKEFLPYYNFKKIIFAIPKGNGNFEKFVEIWKLKEEIEE